MLKGKRNQMADNSIIPAVKGGAIVDVSPSVRKIMLKLNPLLFMGVMFDTIVFWGDAVLFADSAYAM